MAAELNSWRESEAADLDFEADVVEGVVVEEDSAGVA